jgi:hypothetical protein
VFQNRALRRIFGPKREEITREWSRVKYEYIMRSLMICIPQQIVFR